MKKTLFIRPTLSKLSEIHNNFKKFNKNEEPKFLKTLVVGDSFGELALLYNAPRAASVQAKTDSVLWELDRATFNNIVKEAS